MSPRRDESKQLEMQIKAERSSTEKKIAVLKTEIENLQNGLEARIKAERSSTEKKIVILKAKMENLQNKIDQLNEKVKGIQQKIDQGQAKIEELSTLRNRRFLNRNKMELQVNQFLNGWCRFVAHSADGTTDVSAQIDRIKQVAYETLNQYYEGLQDYSSQYLDTTPL